MSNNTWLEFRDVINQDPSTKIWCVSDDGRVDFMMTAGEIKATVGNFDWEGVHFGLVLDPKPKKEEEKPVKSATISGKKLIHKIEIFTDIAKDGIVSMVNKFIQDKEVVNIEYQAVPVYDNGIKYTVMIHYIEK